MHSPRTTHAWTSLALTLSLFGFAFSATAHAQTVNLVLSSQLLAAEHDGLPRKVYTRAEKNQRVRELRLCERRLVLGLSDDAVAIEALHARSRSKMLRALGGITWAVGYGVSIIAAGVLGTMRIGVSLGNSSDGGQISPGVLANVRHWAEPLIPFAGAFVFAGHTLDSGLVALGVVSGLLQIFGASVFLYYAATMPDSPCDHGWNRSPLEFRF